jgi:hypothetical protein
MPFWKQHQGRLRPVRADQDVPPVWDVCERQYIFNPSSGGGALNAMGACPAGVQNAALTAKQQADEAAFANTLAAQERKATEEAAIKARGEAVGGAVSGIFSGIGNLFGGGKDEDIVPVMSGKTAPVPFPRPNGP